jgi:hypothetical protein
MTMDAVIPLRLELVRTGPCEWMIVEAGNADGVTRSIADVLDDEDDVVVSWQGEVPLPTRYRTAEEALDDIMRWLDRTHGGTRPIPIPHFPPVALH